MCYTTNGISDLATIPIKSCIYEGAREDGRSSSSSSSNIPVTVSSKHEFGHNDRLARACSIVYNTIMMMSMI
jgi:hypothetical protein